jgi:hypothetical protein
MNQEERLIRVLNYLETNKTMNIKKKCVKCFISQEILQEEI